MAKTTDWGLTDAGFRRPTYAELLDALEYKARELFGSKANLTVRSPLGIFLRIYAWMLNLLFSTLEDVYNSRFVDTAVGHSLYNLGRAIGLRLLGAQKAVGYLTFTGEIGTEVPEGYLAETVAGQQYITLQSGVILDGSITLPAFKARRHGGAQRFELRGGHGALTGEHPERVGARAGVINRLRIQID